MGYFTKYGRRVKLNLIKAFTISCFVCLMFIPALSSNGTGSDIGYYSVVLNGEELGAVNSVEEANQAMANARKKISTEYSDVVYMDPQFEVKEQSRFVGKRMSMEDIEDEIYINLASSIVDVDDQKAYTVRIDDFSVTVASKEDAIQVIEGAKQTYDANNEFQVSLTATGSDSNEYVVDITKAGITGNNNDIVAAALNGTMTTSEDNKEAVSSVTDISFSQNVMINETAAAKSNVMSVADAIAAITSEKTVKTVYTIESGDTLESVAKNNKTTVDDLLKLNEGYKEDSALIPGEQLIVTTPAPELSIVTTHKETYEEDYDADVQYVENENLERGTSNVIQEGSKGHRTVTADVRFVNGKETSRTVEKQTVTQTAVPEIIEVGTKTPGTYQKPISGGTFVTGFDYDQYQFGVDWACEEGTSVKASADGKVIRASWYSDYGYCVDIQHEDGVVTRYGQLSSFNVAVGDTVKQGDVIAYSGDTGNSSQPHLHFEVLVNGNPVNPLNYVSK